MNYTKEIWLTSSGLIVLYRQEKRLFARLTNVLRTASITCSQMDSAMLIVKMRPVDKIAMTARAQHHVSARRMMESEIRNATTLFVTMMEPTVIVQ